ncbi:MAG: hypothetical protein ACF8Q5_01930 [Phycisphaerales bacterium JB040]
MINKKEFEALAHAEHDACLTVCLPTHRHAPETQQDPIRLKNLIAEAESRLDERGIDRRPLATALDGMEQLLSDTEFWKHQGDGLAVFASPDGLRVRRLPVRVEEFVLAGDRYGVRPLLPAVSDGARFYVLALSQKQVRLLECTRSAAREVDAHDIPDSLRDALGYDWEQKSLQFHTGAQPTGAGGTDRAAVFHGHGRGGDEDRDELEQFLLRVESGLSDLLAGDDAPLVLAGVEHVTAAFRNLSDHPRTLDDAIDGNPEQASADDLHRQALGIVSPTLDAGDAALRERINAIAHSDSVSTGLETVLPALARARAGAVLVSPDEPVWGVFEEEPGEVTLHDTRRAKDSDLLNDAVLRAVATGAEVVPTQREHMPDDQPIAAELRF